MWSLTWNETRIFMRQLQVSLQGRSVDTVWGIKNRNVPDLCQVLGIIRMHQPQHSLQPRHVPYEGQHSRNLAEN